MSREWTGGLRSPPVLPDAQAVAQALRDEDVFKPVAAAVLGRPEVRSVRGPCHSCAGCHQDIAHRLTRVAVIAPRQQMTYSVPATTVRRVVAHSAGRWPALLVRCRPQRGAVTWRGVPGEVGVDYPCTGAVRSKSIWAMSGMPDTTGLGRWKIGATSSSRSGWTGGGRGRQPVHRSALTVAGARQHLGPPHPQTPTIWPAECLGSPTCCRGPAVVCLVSAGHRWITGASSRKTMITAPLSDRLGGLGLPSRTGAAAVGAVGEARRPQHARLREADCLWGLGQGWLGCRCRQRPADQVAAAVGAGSPARSRPGDPRRRLKFDQGAAKGHRPRGKINITASSPADLSHRYMITALPGGARRGSSSCRACHRRQARRRSGCCRHQGMLAVAPLRSTPSSFLLLRSITAAPETAPSSTDAVRQRSSASRAAALTTVCQKIMAGALEQKDGSAAVARGTSISRRFGARDDDGGRCVVVRCRATEPLLNQITPG